MSYPRKLTCMSYQGVEVHPAVPPPRSPGRPVAGAPGLASLGLGGRESAGPDARSGRAGRAGTGSGRGDLPDRDVRAWMQAAAMPGHRVEGTDRCLIGVTDGRGPASPTLHGNVADKCPGIDAQAVLVNPNPVSPDLSSGLMAGAWRFWTTLLGMNLASGCDSSPAGGPGGRGLHRPRGSPSWVAGMVCAGQGACGSASICCHAAVIASAHGQVAWIFRQRRPPPPPSPAAACSTRYRSVFGSALARSPSKARSLSQASRICPVIEAGSHAALVPESKGGKRPHPP